MAENDKLDDRGSIVWIFDTPVGESKEKEGVEYKVPGAQNPRGDEVQQEEKEEKRAHRSSSIVAPC